MKIRSYKDSDRKAWDEYVNQHPDASVFHQIGWKHVIEKSFGHRSHYLIAESSGGGNTITGIFPLFSIKSMLFVRCLVSLPFATIGGIVADDEESSQALFEEAVCLTQTEKLDYLEIREKEKLFKRCVVKDLYYGFKKEIFPDNEQNLMAIPRKSRRMVRRGIRGDLRGAFGGFDLLDRFYQMFAVSYHRLGTPVFSKKFLKNILVEFGETSTILLINKNGKPLSGVLNFYFKDQVLPYYSGAYPESHEHAANDYLYWVLMSDAADKGYRVFDFGRSKENTGPFDFKRHWGFEPKPLPYQYRLNRINDIPNISPSNPKYQRRIELWRKMPLWATRMVGPRLVKYIP